MWINILIFGSLAAVVLILFAGLLNLGRAGDKAKKRSNKLMRWRIGLQAVALAFLMLGFYLKSQTGG
ncbi:MAG: twin transmembrane helix small protein [Robiginitomaculum sp.]|nr:twin transmembrane helix small protein [Robiginitomaculum sp.]